jgi:hypothetical protein
MLEASDVWMSSWLSRGYLPLNLKLIRGGICEF